MSSHTLEQTTAVQVTDLRMRYGTNDVLHGVDFTIGRGEVLVLLGPNGAGKTTTIEILEGFRRPSDGRVTVLGVDPTTADEHWRARIGVVLQSWRDHGRWRVRELLGHLGSFYAPYSKPGRRRPYPTDELIETVGLAEHRNKKVSTLSGGQRRRLDVAIGTVGRPELLFLDEPTAGFDPAARRDFRRQRQRRGTGLSGGRQRRGALDPGRDPAGAFDRRADGFRQGALRSGGAAGTISQLDVQQPSLEATYLTMVAQQEVSS